MRTGPDGPSTETPEQRTAETVAEGLYNRDRAAQAMGVEIESVGPGYARLAMTVRADMLNGFAICHGGVTFGLADTAFAYACNARNEATVALSCDITYTAPAKEGDRLVAVARERSLHGRTGVYDIDVIDRTTDRTVALFRGKSYRIGGAVVENASQPDTGDG